MTRTAVLLALVFSGCVGLTPRASLPSYAYGIDDETPMIAIQYVPYCDRSGDLMTTTSYTNLTTEPLRDITIRDTYIAQSGTVLKTKDFRVSKRFPPGVMISETVLTWLEAPNGTHRIRVDILYVKTYRSEDRIYVYPVNAPGMAPASDPFGYVEEHRTRAKFHAQLLEYRACVKRQTAALEAAAQEEQIDAVLAAHDAHPCTLHRP